MLGPRIDVFRGVKEIFPGQESTFSGGKGSKKYYLAENGHFQEGGGQRNIPFDSKFFEVDSRLRLRLQIFSNRLPTPISTLDFLKSTPDRLRL